MTRDTASYYILVIITHPAFFQRVFGKSKVLEEVSCFLFGFFSLLLSFPISFLTHQPTKREPLRYFFHFCNFIPFLSNLGVVTPISTTVMDFPNANFISFTRWVWIWRSPGGGGISCFFVCSCSLFCGMGLNQLNLLVFKLKLKLKVSVPIPVSVRVISVSRPRYFTTHWSD